MASDARRSVLIGDRCEPLVTLSRSKSATILKSIDDEVGVEDLLAVSRLLSIAVAMLETNNDNEYLLALHLLDRVSHCRNISVY